MHNNSGAGKSSHFHLWILVLSLVVFIGTLVYLAVLKGVPNINNGNQNKDSVYGILIDKGQIDSLESKYGRVAVGIQDESDENKVKKYFVNISDETKYFKDISNDEERVDGNRKFEVGSISEIKKAMYIELYLDNLYENLEARVTTIIYWD